MPGLIVTVNIPLIDADGKDHRARKEVDLFDSLTAAQKTAITSAMNRIAQAVETRYGPKSVVESIKYSA